MLANNTHQTPLVKMPLASLTILRRLEAATSRLEDLVPTMSDASASTNGIPALPEAGLSTGRGIDQQVGSFASPQAVLEPLPPAIDDFDGLINGDVKTFVNMSEEIGGLVAEQVHHQKTFEIEEHRDADEEVRGCFAVLRRST